MKSRETNEIIYTKEELPIVNSEFKDLFSDFVEYDCEKWLIIKQEDHSQELVKHGH